jgi:hypothetical protein
MVKTSNMVSLKNPSGSESKLSCKFFSIFSLHMQEKYGYIIDIDRMLTQPIWGWSLLGTGHMFLHSLPSHLLFKPTHHPLRLLPKTQTVKAAAVLKLHPTKSPACNETQTTKWYKTHLHSPRYTYHIHAVVSNWRHVKHPNDRGTNRGWWPDGWE